MLGKQVDGLNRVNALFVHDTLGVFELAHWPIGVRRTLVNIATIRLGTSVLLMIDFDELLTTRLVCCVTHELFVIRLDELVKQLALTLVTGRLEFKRVVSSFVREEFVKTDELLVTQNPFESFLLKRAKSNSKCG
jgi:hypothetical protein